MLPGIFQETIFTKKVDPGATRFIRPMHPKSEIRPTSESIQKVLEAGWIGQLKIHGHRAQIHISVDPSEPIIVYNRQGQIHKQALTTRMCSELRRVFSPSQDWNVLDGEWIKADDKIYVFDFIKRNGILLQRRNYQERWKLLPRAYLSPCLQTLGVFTSLNKCLEALRRPEEYIEGLVFKSPSPGFKDSSIVRCRK